MIPAKKPSQNCAPIGFELSFSLRQQTCKGCEAMDMKRSAEPRKKPSYFPLNPGWLIGIITMVFYNPCITG